LFFSPRALGLIQTSITFQFYAESPMGDTSKMKEKTRGLHIGDPTIDRSSYQTGDAASHIRHVPETRSSQPRANTDFQPTQRATHYSLQNALRGHITTCKRALSLARPILEGTAHQNLSRNKTSLHWGVYTRLNKQQANT
jgi:hypothetical protein